MDKGSDNFLQTKVDLVVNDIVKNTLERDYKDENVKLIRSGVQTISKLTLEFSAILAQDLLLFSKHGKRQSVNKDDVFLCARKSKSLRKALFRHQREAEERNPPAKKRKKKQEQDKSEQGSTKTESNVKKKKKNNNNKQEEEEDNKSSSTTTTSKKKAKEKAEIDLIDSSDSSLSSDDDLVKKIVTMKKKKMQLSKVDELDELGKDSDFDDGEAEDVIQGGNDNNKNKKNDDDDEEEEDSSDEEAENTKTAMRKKYLAQIMNEDL